MTHDLVAINPWMMLPFGVLLAAIALAPLLAANWWAKHFPKVSFGLGAITLIYYGWVLQSKHRILDVGLDYVSFIALIGSLYVVSGGIHVRVKGEATPSVNVLFLLVGAVVSNVIGTTGASMLLIRPWLRMNHYRITAHHVVFFIFIVSNVGGCLTPIGDPPLFLGYLRGVPFWWILAHAWPAWLTALGILLAMFYVVDRRNFMKAPKQVRHDLAEGGDEWHFDGLGNLVFLAVILGAVFLEKPVFLREVLMVGAAAGSYLTTRKDVHVANHFNFHPIKEVAILFAGIFATMLPALDWLKANSGQMVGPSATPFYWGSGVLSSVLDNAPTYCSFLSAAMGVFADKAGTLGANADPQAQVLALLADPAFCRVLLAVSVGSVFFGANTYIGNGPNFMVKAIADQQKVHTPDFLGYILRFTLPFMVPMLIVVWWLFFR